MLTNTEGARVIDMGSGTCRPVTDISFGTRRPVLMSTEGALVTDMNSDTVNEVDVEDAEIV